MHFIILEPVPAKKDRVGLLETCTVNFYCIFNVVRAMIGIYVIDSKGTIRLDLKRINCRCRGAVRVGYSYIPYPGCDSGGDYGRHLGRVNISNLNQGNRFGIGIDCGGRFKYEILTVDMNRGFRIRRSGFWCDSIDHNPGWVNNCKRIHQ